MPTISGDHTDIYYAAANNKKFVFTNTFHGHDTDVMVIDVSGDNNSIVMNGLVEPDADYYGINVAGSNMRFRIGPEGIVRASGPALGSSSVNAHLINEGLIFGAAGHSAVFLTGENTEFRNLGTIAGTGTGIDVRSDGSVVVNERGGSIAMDGSSGSAVWMMGFADVTLRFVNHGEIGVLSGWAILGDDSDDKVRNTGAITGDISLGTGDDLVDNRGGVIRGVIQGGVGDDTLITDSNQIRLVETSGQGEDQVKSTVSYTLSENVEQLVLIGRKNIDGTGTAVGDRIYGNAGNNHLHGLDGIDTLRGMGGNDVLTGGNGADRFYFNRGYDRDTIDDFQQGSDRVFIEDWAALSTLQAVKSHASNHGQDVWISVGDDTLVIKGLHKADLTAGDFFFS